MRLWSVFCKALREQWRDRVALVLTLIGAPFFVFVYWLMYQATPSAYTVLVLNQDAGVVGSQALHVLQETPLLMIREVPDRAAAEVLLRNREADALYIFPNDLSQALAAAGEDSTRWIMVGDATNPRYTVAVVVAGMALDRFVGESLGLAPPVGYAEELLGASGSLSEFDMYVPGLLVVAVVMTMFKAAMVLTAEVENGTLRRLRLTAMTAFDLVGGVALAQVLVGVASVLLTFATAYGLGFRSQGPLWLAVLVTSLAVFAVTGFGLLTACFCRTATEASVVVSFPMLLLMFFGGAFFPLPRVELFAVAGRVFSLSDFVPLTQAVGALNKVLTLGAGFHEIAYELVAVTLLSGLYFALGVALYYRRHMRPV